MRIIEDFHGLCHEKLNNNIRSLSDTVTKCCDKLIEAIQQRKIDLLNQIEDIRLSKTYQTGEKTGLSDIETKRKNCTYSNPLVGNEINNGSALRFVHDDVILNLLNNYGLIDEERACAANSTVSGLDLKFALVNEPIQFELETRNKIGELSWVEQDEISVRVQKDDEIIDCVLQNQCNGVYTVLAELPDTGNYNINIQVNGNLLPGCPYHVKCFERNDIKFIDYDTPDTMLSSTFNVSDTTAFVGKTEDYQILNLRADSTHAPYAWKVKVTTACQRMKVKFGYACAMSRWVPDLREEFCKEFDFSDLLSKQHHCFIQPAVGYHHSQNSSRRKERKRSSYERNSLTFFIVQDTNKRVIHIAVEQLKLHHVIKYEEGQDLQPFIGIKHFCSNSSCPRPMLTLT